MPGPQVPAGLGGAPQDALAADSAAAVADAAPAIADSAGRNDRAEDAEPDSAAAARLARIGDVRQRPRFDQPRWVMLRSLVFPGWGQAHNRAWFKALGVASLEGWMITRIVDDERDLTGLLDDVNRAQQEQDLLAYDLAVNRYNQRFDASVSRRWLLGAVILYAVVDAYVDAHFVDFGVQFDRDPALPGGRKSVGVRLGLRSSW
jgi:hypothetical protein